MRLSILILLVVIITLTGACNLFSPNSSGNAPEGHTVNKSGTFHKAGLDDPLTNCVQCHGSDLRGGSAGVSCFQCHGQKW